MTKYYGVFKLITRAHNPIPANPVAGMTGIKTIELIPVGEKAFKNEQDAMKLMDILPDGGYVLLPIYMREKKEAIIKPIR